MALLKLWELTRKELLTLNQPALLPLLLLTKGEREKARLGLLAHDRETVVALVTQKFPNLSHLAQKQVQGVEDIERLQKLMLQVNAAHESMEVTNLLLDLDTPG